MKTWFDFETRKWVSEKPKRYWIGLVCSKTGEKIFTYDEITYEMPDYFTNRRTRPINCTIPPDFIMGTTRMFEEFRHTTLLKH